MRLVSRPRIYQQIVIMGAGGFAREAYCWARDSGCDVLAFFAETASAYESTIYGVPIIGNLAGYEGKCFLVAVGNPKLRHHLHTIAEKAYLHPCDPIIHPSAIVGENTIINRGSIICPHAVLTCDVTIERGCLINLNATIGHGTVVGAYSNVAPGANISGNCTIGMEIMIGTNACLREGISLGEGSMVGAGSVVVKNVPRGTTVVGNPARELVR